MCSEIKRMIIANYKLDKQDYLADSLFNDEKSQVLKRKRRMAVYAFSALFVAIAAYAFFLNELMVGFCCAAMALFYYFLYPIKLKNRVIKLHAKTIEERYASRFDKLEEIAFDDYYFHCNRNEQVSKINLSSFESLHETQTHFFLKNKNGNSYIIPKYKLKNLDAVKAELMKIVEKEKLQYEVEMNWEYKVI